MKFILLNGSSCSGKSTVIKSTLKEKNHYFHLSYDSLKWSFSQYTHDTHQNDVFELVYAVANKVCALQYDVICDSVLWKEWRQKLIDLAHASGHEIIEINLEAEYEVLEQRFTERVANASTHPHIKISNLSKVRFKELFDIFQREKNNGAISFRTDKQSVEEVSEQILNIL